MPIIIDNADARALRKEADNRKDPRIKRYYTDMATLAADEVGNPVEAIQAVPYMKRLNEICNLMPDASVASSEQKFMLGYDLFETTYDFRNAVSGEMAAYYQKKHFKDTREKIKKSKNNEETKNKNRSDVRKNELAFIYKAHTNLLKEYDKFRLLTEASSDVSTNMYKRPLNEILGRTNESSKDLDIYMGMIRGERQAIENGWEADELPILGAIGAIEAGIEKYEKYNPNLKVNREELEAFKADFYTLKTRCYYRGVSLPVDKSDISREIKNFIDAHKSLVAKECMTGIEENKEYYDQILDKGIVLHKQGFFSASPHEKRDKDAPAYLADCRKHSEETGNFRTFAYELCRIEGIYQYEKIHGGHSQNSYNGDGYIRDVRNINRSGLSADQLTEIYNEVNKLVVDYSISLAQKAEIYAARIRSGSLKVDKSLDLIKTDYKVSKALAYQMLVNTDDYKMLNGAIETQMLIGAKGDFDVTLEFKAAKKLKEKYLKERADGLTEIERRNLFKDATNITRSKDILAEYGVNFNPETKKATVLADTYIDVLRRNNTEVNEYVNRLNQMKERATAMLTQLTTLKNHKGTAKWDPDAKKFYDSSSINEENERTEIDPKKANSPAFMKMYNSLKKVAELSIEDSPAKIQESFEIMSTAAADYETKINRQWFAAMSKNGDARLKFAGTMKEFADSQKELLSVPESRSISYNASLSSQVELAVSNVSYFIENSSSLHMQLEVTGVNGLNKKSPDEQINETELTYKNDLETNFKTYNQYLANKEGFKKDFCCLVGAEGMRRQIGKKYNSIIRSSEDFSPENIERYGDLLKARYSKFIDDNIKNKADFNKLRQTLIDEPETILDDERFTIKVEKKQPVKDAKPSSPQM